MRIKTIDLSIDSYWVSTEELEPPSSEIDGEGYDPKYCIQVVKASDYKELLHKYIIATAETVMLRHADTFKKLAESEEKDKWSKIEDT